MKKVNLQSKVWIILVSEFVLIFGFYSAFKLRWISDDIFITFRYIENWLNGLGLVYNSGEKVEGYTHFLWLLLIACFQKLGFNPIDVSEWLGLISYLGILIIFLVISYRKSEKIKLFLPLTAIVLALHYDFRVWASGGLETSFFTLLIVISYFLICFSNIEETKRIILSGFILTLALLTRPDAIIFYVITFTFVLIQKYFQTNSLKSLWKIIIQFNLAFLFIYVPYFLWRYSYYGEIFPNTYYAKSGSESYYKQGFFYLYYYIQTYWTSFSFLIGLIYLFKKLLQNNISLIERIKALFLNIETASILLASAYVVIYLLSFVTRVGGDFMYARFVIPLVPFLYFVAESSLPELFLKRKKYIVISYILIIVMLPVEIYYRDVPLLSGYSKNNNEVIAFKKLSMGVCGIVDERLYYTRKNFITGLTVKESAEQVGKEFKRYFQDKKVRVLIGGAQACLAYYSKFHYTMENFGLTDSYIAHQFLKQRGRPGHEKTAPHDYIISKKIQFIFNNFPDNYSNYQYIQFKIQNRDYFGCIITYDRKLMSALKDEFPDEISFIDFEHYLDEYIANMKNLSKEMIKTDYQKFKEYYFLCNSDPNREKFFLQDNK